MSAFPHFDALCCFWSAVRLLNTNSPAVFYTRLLIHLFSSESFHFYTWWHTQTEQKEEERPQRAQCSPAKHHLFFLGDPNRSSHALLIRILLPFFFIFFSGSPYLYSLVGQYFSFHPFQSTTAAWFYIRRWNTDTFPKLIRSKRPCSHGKLQCFLKI